MTSPTSTRWAFKEWAAICAALDAGAQSLILRKGGIHEGRAGFRVEHAAFWLFPTQFHQDEQQLSAKGARFLTGALAPPEGRIRIANFVRVEHVLELRELGQLPQLIGLHHWSEQTVDERFHYRQAGLFALVVRVYRLPQPLILPDSPHFGGCRSWVDLPEELPTGNLVPVLSDAEHAEAVAKILAAVGESRLA